MPRYSSPITSSSGHGDVVHGICWSADGKQLATACEDMYVRVFDVADVCNREPKFRRIKAARIPVGAGFADAQADRVAVVMKGECEPVGAGFADAQADRVAVVMKGGQGRPSGTAMGAFAQGYASPSVICAPLDVYLPNHPPARIFTPPACRLPQVGSAHISDLPNDVTTLVLHPSHTAPHSAGIPDTVMAMYASAASKTSEGGSVEQLWQVGTGGGERGGLGQEVDRRGQEGSSGQVGRNRMMLAAIFGWWGGVASQVCLSALNCPSWTASPPSLLSYLAPILLRPPPPGQQRAWQGARSGHAGGGLQPRSRRSHSQPVHQEGRARVQHAGTCVQHMHVHVYSMQVRVYGLPVRMALQPEEYAHCCPPRELWELRPTSASSPLAPEPRLLLWLRSPMPLSPPSPRGEELVALEPDSLGNQELLRTLPPWARSAINSLGRGTRWRFRSPMPPSFPPPSGQGACGSGAQQPRQPRA